MLSSTPIISLFSQLSGFVGQVDSGYKPAGMTYEVKPAGMTYEVKSAGMMHEVKPVERAQAKLAETCISK